MSHAWYLAWRHLLFHRRRSAMIVVAIALVALLPLALRLLVEAAGRAIRARAIATPLVIGTRGSELDLAVAALTFAPPAPRSFAFGALRRLEEEPGASGRTTTGATMRFVPLHLGIASRRRPVVGTTLDYFEVRGRTMADGRAFAMLGECVLGARVARDIDRSAGVITDAVDPYNLAGTLPLRLEVVGVLAPTGTADDEAIFVDIKTAWTIEGLGHGHLDAKAITNADDLIGVVQDHVVTSERLRHADAITPDNAASFHFHGDASLFPIHAILAFPADAKSGTILQGRFQRSEEPLQIVKPVDAIDRLLREVVRVRRFVEVMLLAVGAVTMSVVGLVFALSVRMRQDEFATMVRLGAARGTMARMIVAELLLLMGIAAILVAVGLFAARAATPWMERTLLRTGPSA